MPIEYQVDKNNNLTVFTAKGNPSFEEFMTAIQEFYNRTSTEKVLWDLTHANTWDISGQEVEKLAGFGPRFDEQRKGSKTAIVASDEMTRALSKLFVLFGSARDIKVNVKIFEIKEDAVGWILADD